MGQWHFEITDIAETDLKRLDPQIQRRIKEKLYLFIENFDSVAPLPLHDPWRGFFKLRVGDWRIVYEVEPDKKLITIHVIDNRDSVYRRRKG
ncbi:MAG: type II toxin-antitoxin system RelE/ParE family toxin [Candidatus Sungiibacteriota bacterium]|uniref:Type II toxin-antitoxin system RelE/ParE family toxin n=1 Tax=Candidatus Sungiibacteriota bacterium TaxID=2750080 RepID=A0A7T5UQG9_9BACT|nr:MAG: type II toxin-antitoxin system RelE/ParE family toxin [Candidatus Sungbacteria bacterium]